MPRLGRLQLVREGEGYDACTSFPRGGLYSQGPAFPEWMVWGHQCNVLSHLSTSHNDPRFDERAIAYARNMTLPMVQARCTQHADVRGGALPLQRR